MPFVTTDVGQVHFAVAMAVFLVQEFSQGFSTPDGASVRDDRWALVYLEFLPALLVAGALVVSFADRTAWSASEFVFRAGMIALGLGVGVRQWSHWALGRFHQARVTVQHGHELITAGPYRWVRHPMYAGSAVALLGVGLMLGTWLGLALCFVGTLPAMVRRIQVEERALAAAFGDHYDDYAADRARMIPRLW